MSDVFLSYSRTDRPHAEAIAKELKSLGVEVWWDHDLMGGEDFRREITAKLERVAAAVVLWSQRSVDSRWVINEAAAAGEKGMLIPVSLDGAKPPLDFRSYHTVDFVGWVPGDRLPEGFLKAIAEKIGRELHYGAPSREDAGIARVARQVTQSWWFDFEAILFFLIGQAIACFICNLSVAAAVHKAQEPLRKAVFGYVHMGYGFSLVVGLMVAALYMRPVLESRRLASAMPLFVAGTLLSFGSYIAAEQFTKLESLPMLELVGPATLVLLLVTTIANKALRRT